MKTPTSTSAKQQNKTLFSTSNTNRRRFPLSCKELIPNLLRESLGVRFGVLLIFFSLSLNAQVAIEWQRCLGGTDNDRANSIQQTADGGYVVAGFVLSNNGDVTGNHGSNDFWVVKLDTAGNIQWQKCLGGTSAESANSIKQTTDYGYIVAGITYSNNGDVSGNHGWSDAWIVKLDWAGNIQWQRCLGGSNYDEANSVQQTFDGGFVVACNSSSNDGDVSGNHGNSDYWVVKLDASGNIQWQQNFGGTEDDYAYSICQTADSGFAVAGYTWSNDGDVSGNHGSFDVWVVKLDVNGNMQWQKCLGGTLNEWANSIQQTVDGGYVVAAYTESNDGDVSDNHGNQDYWIVKLDGTGNIQWQKCLGGTNYDRAYTIQLTVEGGYVVVGTSNSYDGNVSGNHGADDFWIVKLDGAGNIQWQKCFGGTNYEIALAIQQTTDGNYVAVGYSDSDNGNVSGNHGSDDFWVVKINWHYNLISGNLFYDANSNNIQDAGEPSLPNRKVNELNTGLFEFSGANGIYYIAVNDSGNYITSPEPLNYFTAFPPTRSVYFSNIQQTNASNDFAFQPNGVFQDLCVTITPIVNFRSGLDASYVIHYSNTGTSIINNCSVVFLPDYNLTFISSNTPPASVFPDSVIWNIGTLAPFQTGSITVTVNVNVGTPISTQIVSGVRIDPVAGDANPACNYNFCQIPITGAVDPNDILVSRATLLTTEFPNPPFLDYIIRFQNVGNDTAFTVRIYNPIDTNKLDINTLDFVSSSHPVDMRYKFHERTMEFKFENILLPDSTTNEPMSHGFIRYKIKPRSTLVLNDTIPNFAVIHFDFEKPVLTNTAITTVVSPTNLSPGLSPQERGVVWVWPNPASNEIIISFNNLKPFSTAPIFLRLYDLTGRTVLEEKFISSGKNSITLSIASLNKGLYMVEMEVNGEKQRGRFVKGN